MPERELIAENWGEALSLAAPIQHWTAMYDWLYLFREKVPYNPLYESGFDRIGCFMCPSSDLSCMKDIAVLYPEMWSEWEAKLADWGNRNNKSPEWVSKGLWRVRESKEEDGDYDSHF